MKCSFASTNTYKTSKEYCSHSNSTEKLNNSAYKILSFVKPFRIQVLGEATRSST